jgi:mRNA-degrading endonuclease RelE of RelBE toxin-antitoxin system
MNEWPEGAARPAFFLLAGTPHPYSDDELSNQSRRQHPACGGCRLRIGDWRVIFIEDARSITVVAVGNRREIYD